MGEETHLRLPARAGPAAVDYIKIPVAARDGAEVCLLVLGQEYVGTNGFDGHPAMTRVLPHLPFEGEGAVSAIAPSLCNAALHSHAGKPTWLFFCTLKLTFEAHRSAGLSLADVGLGSVLVSIAICCYLGIPRSLGPWWNEYT